jgi:hypothetical protein
MLGLASFMESSSIKLAPLEPTFTKSHGARLALPTNTRAIQLRDFPSKAHSLISMKGVSKVMLTLAAPPNIANAEPVAGTNQKPNRSDLCHLAIGYIRGFATRLS